MSCIQEIVKNLKTSKGNEILDTLRFFHGDNPAREVEAGQQKGGHYYCSNCGWHATRVNELDHALNCPLISFEDRVSTGIIMKPGTVSRSNTMNLKIKPINSLSRQQLEQELGARGIFTGKTKQELQSTETGVKTLERELKSCLTVLTSRAYIFCLNFNCKLQYTDNSIPIWFSNSYV